MDVIDFCALSPAFDETQEAKMSLALDHFANAAANMHRSNSSPEKLLCVVVEHVLRCSKAFCDQAGYRLREWLQNGFICPSSAFAILERWERNPVLGFDPNLTAGVYEHLFDGGALEREFGKWKDDQTLRRRYIEVGYCLSIDAELELYEWAIIHGEIDAVKCSLSTFSDVRKYPEKNQDRWFKVYETTGFKPPEMLHDQRLPGRR